MDIFDKVKGIVVEQLDVRPEEVIPEAAFTTDLGADSLDVVELTMAMDERFKISIPDENAEKILTIQDAVNYIETHIKMKGV